MTRTRTPEEFMAGTIPRLGPMAVDIVKALGEVAPSLTEEDRAAVSQLAAELFRLDALAQALVAKLQKRGPASAGPTLQTVAAKLDELYRRLEPVLPGE